MFGLFYFHDVSLCVDACGSHVDFVARFPSNLRVLSIVLRGIKNTTSKLSATTATTETRKQAKQNTLFGWFICRHCMTNVAKRDLRSSLHQ